MTAAAAKPAISGTTPRRSPRFPAAIPIDITLLRSGVPENIPGRALNLCEGGMAAVVAGQLHRGDPVAVQFRLPHIALPLHAKAVVRHQGQLRYGMEFVGISSEQQAMIRYWAGVASEANRDNTVVASPPPAKVARVKPRWSARLRRALGLLVALGALIGVIGWWHWYRAWDELESQLPEKVAQANQSIPNVPAESMQRLVTHKVDPVYPEAAREANLQGLVLVKAVVGPDGNVVAVEPVSGPDVLAQAAADAVRWWRFQPYSVNGRPEEVETTVALEFHP